MVSIREVAKVAGVSICTVSKALRGSPQVAKATRELVCEAARKMGYLPSPSLSRVAGRRAVARVGRGDPLAFVVTRSHVGKSSAARMMYEGARERGSELGYELSEFFPDDYGSWGEMDRVMWSRGVQGIVFGPQREAPVRGADLRWERYAAVCIGQPWVEAALPLVRVSYLQAVRTVVEQLAAAGYRRIGSVFVQDTANAYQHMAQMSAIMGMLRYPPKGSRVLRPMVPKTVDIDALEEYLRLRKPDALVARSTNTVWMLRERGWRIPEQLGVAVVYRPPKPDKWSRGVAGIIAPASAMGREAVDLIDAALRHGHYGTSHPRDVIVPFEFEWGATLRPLPD